MPDKTSATSRSASSPRTHRDAGRAQRPRRRVRRAVRTSPAAKRATAPAAPSGAENTTASHNDRRIRHSTERATTPPQRPHSSTSTSTTPTFAELGVAVEIVEALREQGIEHTFAIQQRTLPLALEGADIIGQARTGMGKTLGFGVPLLDRIFDAADIDELDGTPRALVVCPTRELANQVSEDLTAAAAHLPVRVLPVYGGTPYEAQCAALQRGVDLVVGTPGRLLDLAERGDLTLSRIAVLVLDEADEMLDLGFLPDIERLLSLMTHPHQTMLFSATMPEPIMTLARGFLHKPVHIRAESPGETQIHTTTRQIIAQAHHMDKTAMVSKILQAPGRGKTIVFARTKRSTRYLANDLARNGFAVAAVHGDMEQPARERSLMGFRNGRVDILVATDVAARGLDVDDVTHVINFATPEDPMTYVHRIGRTGRAGHTGTAVTLVGYNEAQKWAHINDELHLDTPEPPRWFSNSPELHEALNIPEDATETVGTARAVYGSGRSQSSRVSHHRSHPHTRRNPSGKHGSGNRRGRAQRR